MRKQIKNAFLILSSTLLRSDKLIVIVISIFVKLDIAKNRKDKLVKNLLKYIFFFGLYTFDLNYFFFLVKFCYKNRKIKLSRET